MERQVIQPLKEWLVLHKRVEKTMTKRDHKRIDYDRHLDSLKKSKEKQNTKDRDDERKIVKVCKLLFHM